MPSKKIYIIGMHCVSCERLIEDEFKNIPGIESVKADRKSGTVKIRYENQEPKFRDIKEMAEKFDYQAYENLADNKKKGSSPIDWLWAAVIVGGIILFYRVFQDLGLLNKIDLGSSGMSFGIAFLIGLVASVSSCLAIVGAVVITFSEKYDSEDGNFWRSSVRPNVFFHIGRLSTFFILGGLLGLIGGEISLSGNFVSIFTIIIAVIMALLGLNIIGILPSISEMGIRMPKKLTAKWDRLKKSNHRAAPFLLGALSFFLPCGFTQSMQIFALTSGSFWLGGISLFLFALGTLPALLMLGVATSWTKSKKIAVFKKVAGALIIFFAFYTLESGLALRGVRGDVLSSQNKAEVTSKNNGLDQNKGVLGEQTVTMKITASGFEPSILKVKKGIPVKWVIQGDNVTSCTNKITVPDLGINKRINSGENVIRFTPEKAGPINFSCWMGMVRGKFIVE